MKCHEIIERLEILSPPKYAEDWDNIGLLAGRRDKEVEKVYIALDATDEVIADAVDCNADMLLTHHPLVFKKLTRVNTDSFVGRRMYELIKNDISYYAMHTNFDVMGMADAAADELGMSDREVLNVTYEDEISNEGCGRVGRLCKEMSVRELAGLVKERFAVPNVRAYGDLGKIVQNVAVMPGSGGDYIGDALRMGADVMITGDISHHTGIDAVAQGICVIDAGHYGIEKLFIPYMEEFLRRELPSLEVYKAKIHEPFVVI